jgi:hypothetical protein
VIILLAVLRQANNALIPFQSLNVSILPLELLQPLNLVTSDPDLMLYVAEHRPSPVRHNHPLEHVLERARLVGAIQVRHRTESERGIPNSLQRLPALFALFLVLWRPLNDSYEIFDD